MRKLVLLLLGLVFAAATSALAGPDIYSGDAAIYSVIPNDSNRPNILFIIDNSQATQNLASGQPFDPATSYTGSYTADSIYVINQQGTGWNLLSSTLSLSGVTCMGEKVVTHDNGTTTTLNVDVNNILSQNGTYTGAGNDWYPNLDNSGSCLSAPKGDTYATGNYLNYLSGTVVVADDLETVWSYDDKGRKGIYQLSRSHTATADGSETDAGDQPGQGFAWEDYWVVTNRNAKDAEVVGLPPWEAGTIYEMPASMDDNLTQREIFFEALETVITGARAEVNFGAMSYDTQGAKTVAHMADVRDDTDLQNFLDKLPQTTRSVDSNGNIVMTHIPSGTEPLESVQRPQAEALVDAGYYFESDYPGTLVSINATSKIGQVGAMANLCDYDHIILLTNGLPNEDGDPKITNISSPDGDYDGDNYPDESGYGNGSHYLDDVAKYLNVEEGITVHTVLAFQAADELITDAAQDGGGESYVAYSANELQKALQNLVRTIVAEKDTSFVAPVVPASTTNRTISSNRVYLGLFKPQIKGNWHGNLKKYGIDNTNRLVGADGNYATDIYGDFIESSVSFWADQNGAIPSAAGDRSLPDGDGGIVDAGGAGGALLKQSSRNIYTYLTSTNSGVSSANVTLSNSQNNLDIFNSDVLYDTTLEVANQAERNRLLLYLEGLDAYKAEYDTLDWSTIDDGSTVSNDAIDSIPKRSWIMGDVLHSKPLVFNYSPYTENVEGDCSPAQTGDSYNTSLVFVGANDGMLHAVNDCDGSERWAFVPPILLNDLQHLSESGHVTFVDAPPTAYVHDTDDDGHIEPADGDRVILLFGLRRGGGSNVALAAGDADDERIRGAYYALDVTDRDNPKLLWEITSDTPGFSELGETWSQPRLAKVKDGNQPVVVAFFGAGYDVNDNVRFGTSQWFPGSTDDTTDLADPTDDDGAVSSLSGYYQHNARGRGLYAVEVARLNANASGDLVPDFTTSGDKFWGVSKGTNSNSTSTHYYHPNMHWAIPSDLTVLDLNYDGYADTIYAGDVGGIMWRFEVGDSDTANWAADGIFYANHGSPGGGRKFYYKPAVATVNGNPVLYVGTGDRAHPLNTATQDHMYAVIDRGQKWLDDGFIRGTSYMVDLTENELQQADTTAVEIDAILDSLNAPDSYGWYIRLNENAGEKVLAPATVYAGEVFYSTYAPSPQDLLDDCEVGNLGTSRLYHLNYKTGEAVFNYDGTNDSESLDEDDRARGEDGTVLRRSDRFREIGEGIPSGIVTLIDASGHVTMLISSSDKIDQQTATDSRLITPVYWMQW